MTTVPGETRGTLAAGYFRSFSEADVPPLEAIRAATLNAANLLGMADQRGQLVKGLRRISSL